MPQPLSEEKIREWRERVSQWENSDGAISMSRWCRERDINYRHFLYWKERFTQRKLERSSFRELPNRPSLCAITIECNPIRIHLDGSWTPSTLMQCVKALKEALC